MKQLAWVAWRELSDRSLLGMWCLYALLGGSMLVLPRLPWYAAVLQNQGELAAMGALAAAGGVAIAMGVGLGASVIGSDFAQGRMGFYLAQPIPGWSLWGGKMVAAALGTLFACALTLLPAMIVAGVPQGVTWPSGLYFDVVIDGVQGGLGLPVSRWALLYVFTYGAVTIAAISHAAGIAIRARSRWLLLDFGGILGIRYLHSRTFENLFEAPGSQGFAVVTGGLLVLIPIAFLIAGALQTVRGRSDLRRGHRILSITLWSLLLPVAAAAAIYSQWLVGVDATDLQTVHEIQTSPDGGWLALSGTAAGRGEFRPAFLLEPQTGRSLRVHATSLSSVKFSKDGLTAAWIERWRGVAPDQFKAIATTSLGASQPVVERTPIGMDVGSLCLSPDGTRLGILGPGSVTIHQLPRDRPLLHRVSDDQWFSCQFVDNQRLRLLSWSFVGESRVQSYTEVEIGIAEVDIDGRSIEATGRFTTSWPPHLQLGPGLESILAVSDDSTRLLDGVTGEQLALLPSGPGGGPQGAAFLTDARIVVSDRSGIHLFDRRGEPLRSIDLPRPPDRHSYPIAGGQPTADTLLIGQRSSSPGRFTTYLLTLETGRVEASIDGKVPQGILSRFGTRIDTPPPAIGSLATRLLHSPFQHELAAWTDSGLVPVVPR